MSGSFELFCLASGMEALGEMMDHDAQASAVHAMRGVVTDGRTAGGTRRARSVFTAARWRSSGQGFSLACTNMIENVMGTVRRVCRNVKRWRSASMAMRWTAAAMQEAAKGFRRLKAHKQLPALRAALEAHLNAKSRGVLVHQANAA
jgi:hypothetical protein